MAVLSAFIVGLVFGIGLIVAGMTNPAKVQGFLDIAGNWDPSLAFVMGGAILVGLPAFRLAGKRERALLGEPMHLPAATRIERRLVPGSLAFGAGWGLPGAGAGLAGGRGQHAPDLQWRDAGRNGRLRNSGAARLSKRRARARCA